MKKKLVGVGALTLAITACLGGVAFANHAKANIEKGNYSNTCGRNEPGLPVIGTVSFKRFEGAGEGYDTVTLKVAMKHGEPNTRYEVLLAANYPGCFFYGRPISFTTNKKGVGKGSGSDEIPYLATEVFADVQARLPGGAEANNTPSVSLP